MNELPITANGVLAMMASTSTEIDVFSDSVIESVKSGNKNPIKVLIQLKAMDKASERIQKEIKENYMTEAGKYPGTSFEFMGNKIDKQDVSTTYDYTVCQDPEWTRLNLLITEAKEQLKARETFLKTLQKPLTEVDEDTGAISKIHPPSKKSVPGLKVSIK